MSDKFKLKPGFNNDISNDHYHSNREYKSSSALKLILKDPREYYKKYVLGESEPLKSDSLNVGSYAHTRILEPHLEEVEYALWTGSRRSGKEWEKFVEENQGKTIITSSQKYLVDQMIANYEEAHVVIGEHGNEKDVPVSSFFSNGKAEETLCGEINGYKVKVRTDYRQEYEDYGIISDLKTTGNSIAKKEEVAETCEYWNYPLSAALYADLLEQVTGKKHDFYFIFLCKTGTKECKIFKASESFLERGRQDYLKAIELLKEAEKTGVYFENKIEELD
jgi:hypothetical protein